MLGVPLLLGLVVALGIDSHAEALPGLILAVSVLSFYLARYPIYLWVRFPLRPRQYQGWVLATATLGLAAGVALMLGWGRWLLAPAAGLSLVLSLAHLWLTGERQERGVMGELVGVVSLTLTAPLATYAASGIWDLRTFIIWLVCFLFFGSSVFYVKMRVTAAVVGRAKARLKEGDSSFEWSEKLGLGWPVLAYHGSALALAGLLAWVGALPPLAVLALAPVAAHQAVDVAQLSAGINIRRLGFTLLAHSIIFGTLVVVAFYWR